MATFNSTAVISLPEISRPINGLMAGFNLESPGDNMMYSPSLRYREVAIGPCRILRPQMIRWPSGFFADAYQWEKGVGVSYSSRGQSPTDVDGSGLYTVGMGTDEVLNFCAQHGAALLYVANLYTRDADDMIAHLDYIHSRQTARRLQRIIVSMGNEPYLNRHGGGSPDLDVNGFAAAVSSFVSALRKNYPHIEVAVPYRSTYDLNGNLWVHKAGFSEELVRLLAAAGTPVDYWCFHNAYMPGGDPADYNDTASQISASLAGPVAVTQVDTIAAMSYIRSFPIYANSRPTITEFTGGSHQAPDTDPSRSHYGMLQEMDTIRVALEQDMAFLCRHKMMSGTNGAFANSGGVRLLHPQFYGWSLVRQALDGGELLNVAMATDTETILENAATPGRAGRIPAGAVVPLVRAFAVLQGTRLNIILMNMSQVDSSAVSMTLPGTPKRQGMLDRITATDPTVVDDESNIIKTQIDLETTQEGNPLSVTIPPLSLSSIRVDLGSGSQ